MYNNRTYICEVTDKATGDIVVECQPTFSKAKQAMIRKYAYASAIGGYLNFVKTMDGVSIAENDKYQVAIIA